MECHRRRFDEEVRDEYLSGMTMVEIANKRGLKSYHAITRSLDRSKVKRRPMAEYCQDPKYLEKVSNGLQKAHERGCYGPETIEKLRLASEMWWAMPGNRESHPRWMGGISFEPYPVEFNRQLKRKIRERDGYKCVMCGETGDVACLHIHHVDYDKENNDPMNLVTLCPRCHGKTGADRHLWKTVLSCRAHELNLCKKKS